MQLGMIGLGRMGANMVRRLLRGGHECVSFARSPDTVRQLAGEGATGAQSLDDLVAKRGDDSRWQDAHVARQHDQIGLIFP